MNLSHLESIKTKKKRRIGLGHGSGRGKTAGRGTKGQKARGKVPLDFEGGALPLIKRLPFLRGKGKNYSLKPKILILNVSALNLLPKNATVDIETLAKHRIVPLEEAKAYGVKILGDGELQVALTVKLSVSKGAAEKIKKAGGTVDSGVKS
jgi:large subunit ribosomal protein L15